jgi:acyl-CoA reductase-like NAD-dependent aldehyde dehydrogenase
MLKLNDANLFHQQAWIDGHWVDAQSGSTITVTNPANGIDLGCVPSLSAEETGKAIDAAEAAFTQWRQLLAKERAALLGRWYDLMVVHHIDDALSQGAMLLTGGKPHALGGTFFQPTVLSDVTADMTIAADETFGPVAPLIRFSSEDDVVRMANDTPYGLAAYFYARDMGRILRVSEALEYGMVGVNTGLISTEVAPFGGVKQSGIGREGSRYGMDEYLEMKYVCLAGVEG